MSGFQVIKILLLVLWTLPAQALTVVTTLPDLAWIAEELLGKDATVQALLDGHENPHFVDANPQAVLKVSQADVLCFVGLDLEVGYLPALISRSANKQIHKGESGYCDVSQGVKVLGKENIAKDRSHGDVHPHGNPHYYLSPTAMIDAAKYMAKYFTGLNATNAQQKKLIDKNLKQIIRKLTDLKTELKHEFAALGPLKIYEYHKEFLYFAQDYGVEIVGSLEEKPGLAPSAARIAAVAQHAKEQQVKILLAASYTPENHLQKFRELTGIEYLLLPTVMTAETGNYLDQQRFLVKQIKRSLSKKGDGN